jgi:hypothetical protein
MDGGKKWGDREHLGRPQEETAQVRTSDALRV